MASVASCELGDGLDWVGVETGGDYSGQSAAHVEITDSRVNGARFTGTVLDRVRIRDTVIDACDLTGARLGDAALVRVEFRNCRMSAIDLAGTCLRDVRFSETKLDNANFRMVTGDHVLFEHASMGASDFYGAAVAHAGFLDCDLTAAGFSSSQLPGVHLHGSTLDELTGAIDLRGAVIDSPQVLPLALRLFGALGIEVNDDRDPA